MNNETPTLAEIFHAAMIGQWAGDVDPCLCENAITVAKGLSAKFIVHSYDEDHGELYEIKFPDGSSVIGNQSAIIHGFSPANEPAEANA